MPSAHEIQISWLILTSPSVPRVASAVLITLAAVLAVAGWDLQFRSPAAYLWCALYFALTAARAWRLARSGFPWAGAADALLRAAVFGFAAIVLTGFVTGAVGAIGISGYLAVLTAIGVSVFVTTRSRPSVVALPRVPTAVAAVALPLLAFIVAVGLVQSAPTLYDSVSYHLWFSATLAAGSPAFDRADAIQRPRAGLPAGQRRAVLSLADAALPRRPARPRRTAALSGRWRRSRSMPSPGAAARGPSTQSTRRSSSAGPPRGRAGGGRRRRSGVRRDVSASLYWGSSRSSATPRATGPCGASAWDCSSAPVPRAGLRRSWSWSIPVLRGVRLRSLCAIPGILVFGAAVVPAQLDRRGKPDLSFFAAACSASVAPGAFTRAAMNNSVFHVTESRLLPAILAHAFGAATCLVWLPSALAGRDRALSRRRWWPAPTSRRCLSRSWLLFWRVIPDNGDSRFLLPAVAVAMVPLTFTFGTDRRWNAGVQRCICSPLSGSWWLAARDSCLVALVHGALAHARRPGPSGRADRCSARA